MDILNRLRNMKGSTDWATILFYLTTAGAVITLILVVASSKVTQLNAIEDAQTALDREKNRVKEHEVMQKKSKEIIDSVTIVMVSQRDLLEKQEAALSKLDETVRSAESIIQGQQSVIDAQKVLLDKQSETFLNLTGGDGVPILQLQIFPTMNPKVHRVEFYLSNNSKYPIRSLAIEVFDQDKSVDYSWSKEKSYSQNYRNSIEDAAAKITKKVVSDVAPEQYEIIYSTLIETDKTYFLYEFKIRWLSGNYILNLRFEYKDYALVFLGGKTVLHQNGTKTEYDELTNPRIFSMFDWTSHDAIRDMDKKTTPTHRTSD